MKKIFKTLLQIVIFPIALFCVALELFIEKVANLGSLSYGIEHYFKNNI